MPCPRCHRENRPSATFCDGCGTALEGSVLPAPPYAEAQRSLTEALEQQTATAEILGIISRSPGDAQPVFDAIAVNAVRLCAAAGAAVVRYDGALLHLAAHHNVSPEAVDRLERQFPRAPDRRRPLDRAVLDGAVVHVPDLQASLEFSGTVARQFGARSHVSIPLMHQGRAVGGIGISRLTLRPFSDRQIALFKTFADQAVIAIENVRLFTETNDALERQTATGEILRVISSSPTDVQPVFEAIAQSARRLCAGDFCNVARYDGELLHLVAHAETVPEGLEVLQQLFPARPSRETVFGRAVLEGAVVHIPDTSADAEYAQSLGEALRVRSGLGVPMLREGRPIGVIAIGRKEARPFTDTQIALLKTFADQAVIAIENVRLFNETKEALEQQTAASEILGVIASSPTDVQPVFDAIAANAARLCRANDAQVLRVEGEVLRLVAASGVTAMPSVRQLSRGHLVGRAVIDRKPIHVRDLSQAVAEYPETTAARYGVQSALAVPLLREGVALGVIRISRTEIQPFTDKQIGLLKTFADQAVIAIENVRLFKETKEALDQQTATSEILKVISSSPTDVQPVFEAIVRSAVRLCDARFANVFRLENDVVHLAAHHNVPFEALEHFRRTFPQPLSQGGTLTAQAMRQGTVVHIHDVEAQSDVAAPVRALTRSAGYRTVLAVPILRPGNVVGAIGVGRSDVTGAPWPFSDKEVALLRTFAEQAVIAIENVRLFTELQASNRELTTALDTQTATSDILRVISQSQTDVQPVFGAIADSAMRLLGAWSASVWRYEDGLIRLAAARGGRPGSSETFLEQRQAPGRPQDDSPASQTVLTRTVFHSPDVETDSNWGPRFRAEARMRGWRSIVAVPMLRGDNAAGVIAVTRAESGGFAPAEIALLKTFADQAVIAIENARLFNETKEALEQQTATSDILRVISSSPTDVQPVFDAIAESAARLCDGIFGMVYRLDGDTVRMVAHHNVSPEGWAAYQALYPRPLNRQTNSGRAMLDGRVAITEDVEADTERSAATRHAARLVGLRSAVTVPLLREERTIGALTVGRDEPGTFTPEQVALLRTFADQAVIAIENVRLFKELEARTQDLTRSVAELRALGEVGQAISSTLDLRTVLSTIVARATQLSGTDAGVIYEYDEQREVFVPRATEHLEAEIVETMLATPVRKGEGATGRLAEIQEPIQVPDIVAAPAESRVRGALVRAGYRALLAVPLVRDDRLLGGLTVIRKATGEFAPEVIELLRTFATQSALAIQNARLFREIEDKSRQLEVASQHKSEFLANMSHELRTPLNAIIGFSEVLTDRMFGELNEKQDEYLKDIYASGTHLLSLINDILDLSKIEAGRMDLELTDFHLPMALDNALTLVRERAGRRGIALHLSVDERLGQMRADERKVRQVVLNLLSNAIKFTPEGGRIEVGAVPRDVFVEVSVNDTGVGIAPEDQEAVFEEFRQVGTAEKKAEGTGLGLTLCRKFIELHGGRIWVKSQVGVGSTFTFTIPVRRGE